jgi:branched-subunit amino acid ABC-type transport system permease component
VLKIVLLAIVTGIGTGSIYALTALGLTLVLAASGVLNLAQSAIGLGASLAVFGLYQLMGWPFLGVVALLLAVGGIAGMATYFIAVRPVFNRPGVAGNLTEGTLITTLGLLLALTSIMSLAFGQDSYPVKTYVSSNPLQVGGVPIQPIYIVMFVVTVLIVVAFEVFVRRTHAGLYLRMTFEDAEGAALQGVSVRRVILVAFGVGGAVAAIAGALVVPVTEATTQVSLSLGLYGFAGLAIGGYGSFVGALIGGLFVGIVQSLVPVWLNVDLAPAVVYGVLIAVLVVRPQGLFGKAGAFGAGALREV